MPAAPQPIAGRADGEPELSFSVDGASAERHSAAPALNFQLRIKRAAGAPVRSIVLDTQIQIAARRRSYGAVEQTKLVELFGASERWGTTLRTLAWTRLTVVVPPFVDAADVQLQVPCSYDLQAGAASYLYGLEHGEVPLEFLFSGSVFYAGRGGGLQTTRISWEREAEYRLPVALWQEAMDLHFPGAAWLRLDRAAFERLRAYKAEHGLHTLEDAIERLLEVEASAEHAP